MELPLRRTLRRATAVIGLAIAVLTPSLTGGAVPVHATMAAPIRSSWPLAKGVKLTRIRYATTPNELRIMTFIQGHGSVVDVLPAGGSYPAYKLPSTMGAGSGAVGAVNGDFALADGRPAHLSMIDGELWTSGVQDGSAFAINANGSRAWVGHPDTVITAVRVGGGSFRVADWNVGKPVGGTVAAYSNRGGSRAQPPGDPTPEAADPAWCAVRLAPTNAMGWSGSGKSAVARTYTVEAQPEPCSKTRLSLGTAALNVVLAAKAGTTGGNAVRALEKGNTVRLLWGLKDWNGAVDAIGGQPVLVQNGENVAPPYVSGGGYFYNNNPRTAVGINAGCTDQNVDTICKVFIMAVDGRQVGWSRGMKLTQLAKEFIQLGATWAVNLDGGGGTVMWVKRRNDAYCQHLTATGCLVNRPSPSEGQRVAVVGLGVLPSADPGQPSALG